MEGGPRGYGDVLVSIPEARRQLGLIADRLEQGALGRPAMAQEVRNIIDQQMHRESPVRRAPRKLCRMDPDTARLIRHYANNNPEASQLEIANVFNTNPGRVSEALNWKI